MNGPDWGNGKFCALEDGRENKYSRADVVSEM